MGASSSSGNNVSLLDSALILGGSLASGLLGGNAARGASRDIQDAMTRGERQLLEALAQNRASSAPQIQTAYETLNAMRSMMGMEPLAFPQMVAQAQANASTQRGGPIQGNTAGGASQGGIRSGVPRSGGADVGSANGGQYGGNAMVRFAPPPMPGRDSGMSQHGGDFSGAGINANYSPVTGHGNPGSAFNPVGGIGSPVMGADGINSGYAGGYIGDMNALAEYGLTLDPVGSDIPGGAPNWVGDAAAGVGRSLGSVVGLGDEGASAARNAADAAANALSPAPAAPPMTQAQQVARALNTYANAPSGNVAIASGSNAHVMNPASQLGALDAIGQSNFGINGALGGIVGDKWRSRVGLNGGSGPKARKHGGKTPAGMYEMAEEGPEDLEDKHGRYMGTVHEPGIYQVHREMEVIPADESEYGQYGSDAESNGLLTMMKRRPRGGRTTKMRVPRRLLGGMVSPARRRYGDEGGAGTDYGYEATYGYPNPNTSSNAMLGGTTSAAQPSQATAAPKPYDWQTDPGYQFRLGEGAKTIENSALARGGLLSGKTAKALTRYGQDYGSQEFGNVFGRLSATNNATSQFLNNINGQAFSTGNALLDAYLRSSGVQGSYGMEGAGAWNNAIQGGISNYLTARGLGGTGGKP